jgi:outer membrane immunogenic protein
MVRIAIIQFEQFCIGTMKSILIAKRILIALVALATLAGTPALSADLPLKAPPPPPVASWTGWYAGLNGGYGWGNSTGDNTCFTPTGVLGGPGCWAPSNGIVRPQGGLFGGQLGYNWQSSSFVFGLETDIQASGIGNNMGTQSNICCIPAFTSAVGTVTATADLQWFGTARARAGFLVTPKTLLYVTGGLIYGNEATTSVLTYPLVAYNSSGGFLRAGATAGGGLEYAFGPSWSAKIEGLWYDMGSGNIAVVSPLTNYTYQTHFKFDGAIVRGGLNWKFASP